MPFAIPLALATDRLHAVSTDGRPDQRCSPAVLNRQTHLPRFVSRPRMMLLIDLSHPTRGNVGVNLRGGNIGVAQDGLHGPEIGAVLNHVRGRRSGGTCADSRCGRLPVTAPVPSATAVAG